MNAPVQLQAPDGQTVAVAIYRNPPLPQQKEWQVATFVTAHGDIETDASVTISGRHNGQSDKSGWYRPRRPIPNYMLGIWSDVNAPSVVIRGNDLPDSCAIVNLDPATGAENLRIENDGTIRAKSIECQDGVTGEFRAGPWTLALKSGRVMKLEGPI